MIHPHHPLNNQIVKVLRRAGNKFYPEACYLISLPDGTRAEIPVSWAVPVSAGEEDQPARSQPPPTELWAGIGELLALARLVQALGKTLPEEVAGDGQPQSRFFPCDTAVSGGGQPAPLGAAAARAPTGADPGPGGPADGPTPAAKPAGGAA